MIDSPQFVCGQTVYNCITKESGRVERSYESEGVWMYEIRLLPNRYSWSWSLRSDWEETRLERANVWSFEPPKARQLIANVHPVSKYVIQHS
jgi:hypothetical protein